MNDTNALGRVESINVSEATGVAKASVSSATLMLDHGIAGDAHAGDWHRQVSLLALESVQRMRDKGADVNPGDFGENLTVSGLDLLALPLGTELEIGSARLQVSQHGKECHDHCAIYEQVGDCVMPREGIFGVVTRAGHIATGDPVVVLRLGEGSYERVPSTASSSPDSTSSL